MHNITRELGIEANKLHFNIQKAVQNYAKHDHWTNLVQD